MTWNEFADQIGRMNAEQRNLEIVLVDDFDGPEQQVKQVELERADHDLYDGITAGNVLVLKRGQSFLRKA